MTHNIAVIVDAYSTGAKLAAKFHSEGVAVLHVQSASPIIDFYINDFRPGDFIANVVFNGLAECLVEMNRWWNRTTCVSWLSDHHGCARVHDLAVLQAPFFPGARGGSGCSYCCGVNHPGLYIN